MIPATGFEGRRVGVLGLARSGLAAARALAAGGAVPVCWDDGEAARAKAEAAGLELADLNREREVASLDRLIVSPGIPHLYPEPNPVVASAMAAGVPVDNDIGLFFQALGRLDEPPKVVAITGSNGKSTTTALIAHCLRHAGLPAQMGGNIGRGVFDLEPPGEGGVLVLELSSYQIELARTLAPDVAVFLNITPDHLDRHGGMGGYFAAKARLFLEGAPERAVIGVDEPEGVYLANRIEEPVRLSVERKLRTDGWTVFMNRNHLTEWRAGRQQAAVDMRQSLTLRGAHNHQNAAAAWAACRALGLAPRRIEAALMDFPGLAHRLERLGEADGVVYVNDSKATNADAAEKALMAYDNIRWIVGGRAKDGGIDVLRPLFGKVVKAYLVGEAAEAFARTLADRPHEVCGTIEAAVARASAEAAPGEVVLLAPACASFDQYPDFEARGEDFRAQVAPLLGGS
ncbi:MAG TPA: UDP-N-acetylmuramoyl-L-alanine--D-glutamate ligase [Thermohalobaculum sp.]|nr:UDP-N-acetylmuramoyl-L-alanine--D-glutamate ligase [Thermohalobaculum sp.]